MVLLLVIGSLSAGVARMTIAQHALLRFGRDRKTVSRAPFSGGEKVGKRPSSRERMRSEVCGTFPLTRREGGGAPRRRWCGSPHRVARLAVGPISGWPEMPVHDADRR